MQADKNSGTSGNRQLSPVLKNRFVKDVTSEYFGSNDTTIPIQMSGEQYIYLGIFSPGGWIPIDMALGNAGKVTFRDIEPDVIYQTLYQGDGGNCIRQDIRLYLKRGWVCFVETQYRFDGGSYIKAENASAKDDCGMGLSSYHRGKS